MNKKILAIIPARGGSKRLPLKNVISLAGKPLIEWTIRAALETEKITNTIVTSDDDEILKISKNLGTSIIKRPKDLAQDDSTTFDTLKHTIENTIEEYDYILLLQATSPLRNSNHIKEAIELLESKSADAIISVCEVDHSPLWSNTLDKDKNMKNFLKKEVINKRSQDFEKYYRLNGAIYICKISKFLEEESFFLKNNTYAYVMKRENSIDIDEEIDLVIAEALIKRGK